ncbi:acetyl-hydrolase [Glonium stellatum]|uniref:Acetyl-hydrolase n=1 Tax=Glonium stellatum TaxID=574774 RepID=A0A8E2JU30_9PEZI|nr:acetyl-hydrolase [Glonium stellatum]
MDGSSAALLKVVVPKIPFIVKTALLHSLWLSSTSSKWDLRTELTIKILRNLVEPSAHPSTISKQQRQTIRDPGVKGRMWISRVTMPVPGEDDLRQLLFKTIEDLKEGSEEYTLPPPRPLEAEWTGYRAHVPKDAPEPSISETEKYKNLMKEVKSDVTILYFHGGAYFLLDPASHRPTTVKIAKLSGGRVFSVRYRLAPQNPFPAALLDALVAYLSLLYPPPGALHEPIPASKIVFGGDSAGGNLCMVLMQTLLQIHRNSPPGQLPTVAFNGGHVEIPLPAGAALNSPWLDVTRSLPSIEGNANFDYLPPPSMTAKAPFLPCPIWPTNPPRAEIYCEGSALCHPLVSPLAAKSWDGCPPILIVCGQEMLLDEDMVLAQRLAKQNVKVVWQEYEAMPHCFAMVLQGLEAGRMCFSEYANFCKHVVEDLGRVKTEGYFITAKSLVKHSVDVRKLTDITDEDVAKMMADMREKMIARIEPEGRVIPRL